MRELPSSVACLRNREPIANILKDYVKEQDQVLEIGHGTGEHAEYFTSKLPVTWHPADQLEYNWMMLERAKQLNRNNLIPPIELTIGPKTITEQTSQHYECVYTANTLHIISEELAFKLCEEVGDIIIKNGYFFLYGPFKFDGEFTSQSNAQFDLSLKSRDEKSGIRDFEKLNARLEKGKLSFLKRYDMPANNQLLVFQKQ